MNWGEQLSDLERVKGSIDDYSSNYRHPRLSPLEISSLYALFPDQEPLSREVGSSWPDQWPNASCQGVYVIFGAGVTLLYIGKASMRSTIGSRLSRWFQYSHDGDGGCRVVDSGWSSTPRYIATIPVPDDMSFEAPAIEEYLIVDLQPPDNTQGL